MITNNPPWRAMVVATALGAVGCGPAVQSAAFTALPPRPPDHPIRLFSTKLPTCAYEEVGLVSARKRTLVSMDDVLAGLVERAREMGGDAVVGIGQGAQVSGGGEDLVTISSDPVLSGTVIRFTEEGCTGEGAARM